MERVERRLVVLCLVEQIGETRYEIGSKSGVNKGKKRSQSEGRDRETELTNI